MKTISNHMLTAFVVLLLLQAGIVGLSAKPQDNRASNVTNYVAEVVRRYVRSGKDVMNFTLADLMAEQTRTEARVLEPLYRYFDRFEVIPDQRLVDRKSGRQLIAISTYLYENPFNPGPVYRHVVWYKAKEKAPTETESAWAADRQGVSYSLETEDNVRRLFQRAGLPLATNGVWEDNTEVPGFAELQWKRFGRWFRTDAVSSYLARYWPAPIFGGVLLIVLWRMRKRRRAKVA